MIDPLAHESSEALRAIATALRSGQVQFPLNRMALSRVARLSDSACVEIIELSTKGIPKDVLARLLELAALAGESSARAEAELVWTGPEGGGAQTRDTAVVLANLFGSAERSVLVSTMVVKQGAAVFEPLARRMAERPDLDVRLFVHVMRQPKDTRHDSEVVLHFAEAFRTQWIWPLAPKVYYDPRSIVAKSADQATWHAKCVVVDDDLAFVTSANFTEWAQSRNVEAGVLVKGGSVARQLRAQFDGLVQAGAVKRVPGY